MPKKPNVHVNLLRIQKHQPKQNPPIHKSRKEEKMSIRKY